MVKPAPAKTDPDMSSGKDRPRFTMEKLMELKEDGRTLIYYKFLPPDAHTNSADENATSLEARSKSIDKVAEIDLNAGDP